MLAPVRQHLPLALVFLCVGLASAMAVPFLTLFLTDAVSATPVQITVFLVAAPLSSVTVSMAIGRWSDVLPSRRGLIIGACLVGTGGYLLTATIRDFWILLALTVTATATASSLVPQVFAHARASLQGQPGAVMTMSALRTVLSLSWVGGPFLATVLLDAGGFLTVYGFAAVMYLVAAVLAWRILPTGQSAATTVAIAAPEGAPTENNPTESHLAAEEPAGSGPPQETGRKLAADLSESTRAPVTVPGRDEARRVILLTVAALVLIQCTGNLALQTLPLFLSAELHAGLGDAGLILGLCAGLEIPLMLGFSVLANRFRLRALILVGPLLSLAYTLIVAASSASWQLAAAQVLNASSIALLQGLAISYVQDMLPSRPGQASSLFSSATPIGAMLAGPVLGAAAGFGYREVYLIGAGLTVIAFVLLLLARPSSAGPRVRWTTTIPGPSGGAGRPAATGDPAHA